MSTLSDRIEQIRSSPTAKALFLGSLILLLQIPIAMIQGLVGERSVRRAEAMAEVTDKWGGHQQVIGPHLVVPYRKDVTRTDDQGRETQREVRENATFLAEQMQVDGQLETEIRKRGIFEIPLYTAATRIRGAFGPIVAADFPNAKRVEWDQAQIVFLISDPRGIDQAGPLLVDGNERAFEPGMGRLVTQGRGIHAAVGDVPFEEGFEFSTGLTFRGSQSLQFAPMARATRVSLRGDWPDPSFQGAWLPSARAVSADGFEASWEIPYLGRNFPQRWFDRPPVNEIYASTFGVDLISPVDAYRATERSLKYQLLFLTLTFVVIWLVEILSRVPVHPVQYALIGAAICMFYLLELSLSEHVGLETAYAAGALAVIGLVFAYGRSVLRSTGRALILGGIVTGLYGYLYVLLQIEDYALLVGSIGLFGALAAIMWATRRVDWYSLSLEAPEATPTAP